MMKATSKIKAAFFAKPMRAHSCTFPPLCGLKMQVKHIKQHFNNCDTNFKKWQGDPDNPGYAYIPFDYKGIQGLPSPWFDAIPSKLRDYLPRDEFDVADEFKGLSKTTTSI